MAILNVGRNFSRNPSCYLKRIAEKDENRRRIAKRNFPAADVTDTELSVTAAPDIDVAVIATPVHTHFEFARRALDNGKHLWIEKPMTLSGAESDAIVNLAAQKNRIVMVDHTFLFTGAVQTIKQVVDDGELGTLFYYDSVRINLGLFQSDVNVIWDLAPHDLSIIDFILGPKARAISANARGHFNAREDVGYLTIYYDDNLIAHVHVNWLSPVKIRQTTIGGSKKALVWNDMERDTAIKIYDRGVDVQNREGMYDLLARYRMGMMYAPVVRMTEALEKEVEHFVECVFENKQPVNNAQAGARIVKMLEASTASLKENGRAVELAR
jgi:predicted dehydrogenase